MRLTVPALTLLCILGSTLCAQADRRVALVMGNGAYKNVQALPNPTIDATAMAAKLRNVGFEVVEGTDLTREAMTNRLIEFGKKAQGADVAVFFYAGHGIAVNGVNYLLPIDADLQARTISVREAARLQSFPDGFIFQGSMNSAFRQVGNAVPPLLAYAIGFEIANALRAMNSGASMAYREAAE
jgi:uncharacterized caspase-like protein